MIAEADPIKKGPVRLFLNIGLFQVCGQGVKALAHSPLPVRMGVVAHQTKIRIPLLSLLHSIFRSGKRVMPVLRLCLRRGFVEERCLSPSPSIFPRNLPNF